MDNNRKNFINGAIDKMFSLAGHKVSHQDFQRKTPYAHTNYVIQQYQQNEFQDWFLTRVKSLGIASSNKEAENEYSWFIDKYGLKVVQNEFLVESSSF